jgi:hypothetical protein
VSFNLRRYFDADWQRIEPEVRQSRLRAVARELKRATGALFVPVKVSPIIVKDAWGLFPNPGTLEVKIKDLGRARDGDIRVEELFLLSLMAQHLRPKKIFEFGTFDGRTTLHFALNTEPGARIYTLDLPDIPPSEIKLEYASGYENLPYITKRKIGNEYTDMDVSYKITQLFGDSATFDFSDFHNAMDLVFVDAGHSYEYVKSDTLNAFKMLKPGGTIIWHDYNNHPGVTTWLDEFSSLKKLHWIRGTWLVVFMGKEVQEHPQETN